jgi:hypothetical protein
LHGHTGTHSLVGKAGLLCSAAAEEPLRARWVAGKRAHTAACLPRQVAGGEGPNRRSVLGGPKTGTENGGWSELGLV